MWLNDGLEIDAALSCAGQLKAEYNILVHGLDIILSYIYLLLRMYVRTIRWFMKKC
jgi:hypothetical protein